MMGWRCICLLSIPCAAAAAPNATFGALADRVVWARINDTGSYDWPGSTLRHFTPVEISCAGATSWCSATASRATSSSRSTY